MKRPRKSTFKWTGPIAHILALWVVASFTLLYPPSGYAETHPVRFAESFAGKLNFQMTGGSLRTSSNYGDPCSVGSSADARLTGLPASPDRIIAAYLYWAGSGSTPDTQVTFENVTTSDSRTITSTRTLRETDSNWDFFLGFADVTDQVTGNGVYRLSNLTVSNAYWNYCYNNTVLGGWNLIVIYEDSSEPLRVINLYDGFQHFQHSSIRLTPSNFQVPANGCDNTNDCKWGIVTWEGDPTLGSDGENLSITANAQTATITSAANPATNQFNSTVDILGATPSPPGARTHGIDIDIYPLPSWLENATSATTDYSAGQDLVLLSAEVFSVRNTEVADLSISKSHSGNFTVGQQGAYTIRVTNNGPNNATGTVTVTDTLPTGLTYASGSDTTWTCSDAGQVVTCTATSVDLAINTSLPDITLTVNVDATAASSVTNTASVQGDRFDNNLGNNTTTDATTVINTGPSSGTKQLYFYMADAPSPDTDTLQRIPMADSQYTRSNTFGPGNAVNYLLSPTIQIPFVLDAGTVGISIWLRRRPPNNNGTRNVTVTLDDNGGPIGTIGTQTRNGILGSGSWETITFSFSLASPVSLAPGTTLRLTLTNEASSTGGLRARSTRNGIRSQINIDTTTVINVDSINAYTDVAYPGGTVQSSYTHNNNVRIRAVVSDPFGHNDITSATITIIDPNSNTVVTDAPMTEVDPLAATPPAATKTYEYPFTIPAGPNGTWTAMVTANEGSEGTISDLGMGTFLVGMPNIVISKTVSTVSNPVEGSTNAHAIPGAIMQYDIVVTNTGIGPADPGSIIITDPLPDDLRLVLNNSIEPVTFIDGDSYGQSPSGLSFTPGDVGNNPGPFNDVALSNWSGSGSRTFLPLASITHDTDFVDNMTPKINFIRINPKLSFAGSTGGPNPSFTLRFRLRLQ